MTRKSSQRFHIIRGSRCNSYSIMSADGVKNEFLSFQNTLDFEIITVNNSGGVAIKVLNQNKCMTNNIQDNLIPPFQVAKNQLFTDCVAYNSDEKQVFYFYQYVYETNNSYGCKTETSSYVDFQLFEITKAISINSKDVIDDMTNINITGPYNYVFNVGINQSINSFNLWIEEGTYEIDLNLKYPSFYSFTKYSVVIAKFSATIQVKITELINLVTFNLVDYFNVPVTTNLFLGTSLYFTNSLDNLIIHEYVIVPGQSTFSLWLKWGNYPFGSINSSLIADWEKVVVTFDLVISSFAHNNFTFQLREQKVNALIKLKDTFTSLYANTSVFLNGSTFTLTRTTPSTGVQYNYTIVDGITTDIPLVIHFGKYSITATFVPEWESITSEIEILDFLDTNKEIVIKETLAPIAVRFKSIEAGSHDEYVNSCLFADGSTITFTRISGGLNNTGTKNIIITAGCNTVINDTMEKGIYTFSYSLLSNDVNSLMLMAGQTFTVNNYLANSLTVNFEFFGAESHFYLPSWDYFSNTYLYEFAAGCSTGYVIRNFFSSNTFSSAIVLHWVCKRIKYSALSSDYYTPYVSIGFGLDTFLNQNVSCPPTHGLTHFSIVTNGSQYRIRYICYDVLNYIPNCQSYTGVTRDYQNNNYALGNVHIGYADNYLNSFTVTGTPGLTQANNQIHCRTVKNYIHWMGNLQSTGITSTFEFLSLLPNGCSGNNTISYFLYFNNTLGNYNWYVCRPIPSGGTITNYYTTWINSNLNSALTDLYIDCGTGEILKNLIPEWDSISSSIRFRLECITISKILVFKDQFKNLNLGCETTDKMSLTGMVFGDMNNYIKGVRFNMSTGACYAYTKIAVDILYG